MCNLLAMYTRPAEYYYNEYIDMYCVVGTVISMEDLEDLKKLWDSPELLTKVAMPDYITDENYDGAVW